MFILDLDLDDCFLIVFDMIDGVLVIVCLFEDIV